LGGRFASRIAQAKAIVTKAIDAKIFASMTEASKGTFAMLRLKKMDLALVYKHAPARDSNVRLFSDF